MDNSSLYDASSNDLLSESSLAFRLKRIDFGFSCRRERFLKMHINSSNGS